MDTMDTKIQLTDATIAQPDNVILTNINLKIDSGELVYLIGRTGSGKSSLLKTLYADLPLAKGSGTVAGFQLESLRRKQIPYLRRKLGIVFQDFQLLTDRNVHENLLFVLKATGWKNKIEIENRIQDVLNKVGLSQKGYKMPNELSGGEQQRVVIARALLNNPEIILADEPTGNLDPETSRGILTLLTEISHNGRAVLIATHDYSMIKEFPGRIIKCENETLIELKNDEVFDFSDIEK
ncbi:MAG: ATP-binding cassette domain-containing protein [Salinivirgaceae bacterium]|nr:ATP-binding cassette domain-containing protein [Salinivirgaceae bacterium]MBR3568140.1 ATP-binding cassette domain-containing protein [Salinivirgaceae bacterium]